MTIAMLFLYILIFVIVKKGRKLIMASKQEVLDAIAEEKADVLAAIQALKDQIADGSPVTAADLDEIRDAVKGIHGA